MVASRETLQDISAQRQLQPATLERVIQHPPISSTVRAAFRSLGVTNYGAVRRVRGRWSTSCRKASVCCTQSSGEVVMTLNGLPRRTCRRARIPHPYDTVPDPVDGRLLALAAVDRKGRRFYGAEAGRTDQAGRRGQRPWPAASPAPSPAARHTIAAAPDRRPAASGN